MAEQLACFRHPRTEEHMIQRNYVVGQTCVSQQTHTKTVGCRRMFGVDALFIVDALANVTDNSTSAVAGYG